MGIRIIKFRVWDNISKKFLEHTEDIFINLKGKIFEQDYGSGGYETELIEQMYELMQFTGLIDKNGKEIYEGDILKRPDSEINYIVVFNGGCFCIQDSENKHHNLTLLGGVNIFLEIIGNTYKNPELLNIT